jgi:hypothetical protein
MANLAGTLAVFLAVATALIFLIFLVLKVDNVWDVDYGHVTGPLLAFFLIVTAVFGYRGVMNYVSDNNLAIFLYRLGMSCLALGSFLTIFLLTKKFEFELSISFTGAMLPYMVSIFLTGALFVASLNIRA